MASVAIAQNESIELAIEKAMVKTEVEPIVVDKIVAVKPNDTYATEQDTTGVTQPETLRAVIRYLKKFEPKKLIVTGGAGAAETDEVFEITGMMDVVRQEGVEFFDHNRPPFKEVELDYGPQRSVMVNPRVLEYESLVAVNQLKVHDSATVTLAMKNIGMSYPAADYYGHPRMRMKHEHDFFDDLHGFIVGMVKRFPIDLAVTVGEPAMIGTGPLGGKTFKTGLAMVSRDAIAADAVGAKILGFNPSVVKHIWEAGKLGLGETDVEKINYSAMSLEEAIKYFTKKAYGEEMAYEHA